MQAGGRRLWRNLGLAALAVGALTAGACIHPGAPVSRVSVERTGEVARAGGWFGGEAVVYRLGVRTKALPRLMDDRERLRLKLFRCGDDRRLAKIPAVVERADPAAGVTYLRVLVPRRQLEAEAWLCARFERSERLLEMDNGGMASTDFQLQPTVEGGGGLLDPEAGADD